MYGIAYVNLTGWRTLDVYFRVALIFTGENNVIDSHVIQPHQVHFRRDHMQFYMENLGKQKFEHNS